MSSSKNGRIVSKLSLLDLVTTLRAKWLSEHFCSEQWFTYAYLWIEEMQVISDLYNFRCINHLIASSRNLNKTSKKMSKFTHACMEAFMAMKFKVKNPVSWINLYSITRLSVLLTLTRINLMIGNNLHFRT